tara:strand:+ start:1379 stop:1687 length:309 start_codon:yes stop_codon:yes gene_type:complete
MANPRQEAARRMMKKLGLKGFNKWKLTPGHPKKKAVVMAKEGDKTKLIRFGAKGYKHNYSAGARKNFKARHNCDTANSKLTARYWACKALWAGPGGHKRTKA